MLKEPTRRVRFLTRQEADRLLGELPAHLADMAAFALATGLRRANVTGLEWTQVDLERRLAWVHPDQAKARKAIAVPLNAEAVLIIRRQAGKHPTHVFSYEYNKKTHERRPVRQVSTKAWYAALARAGIEDFRWHDLRHTCATILMAQGVGPKVVMETLGHSQVNLTLGTYSHVSAELQGVAAEKMDELREHFGLEPEDLNIDLGPLGTLL